MTKSDGYIKQSVEESIVKCEREAKRKHMPKEHVPKAKKAKRGEPPVPPPEPVPLTAEEQELKASLVDLTDLASDSDDELALAPQL